MTFDEIMKVLEVAGTEQTRRIYANHGIAEPMFGVKISELKKIKKKVKKDYALSKKLYATGNYDAMYLAGLIADEKAMTKEDLEGWMATNTCEAVACAPVAWVAAESSYGFELAREWMTSENETIAAGGWATLGSLVGIRPNEEINEAEMKRYLDLILETIHREREEVKYQMNFFVIAVGGYMPNLSEIAKSYGDMIGKVKVDMGNTSCKVPLIKPYIEKMETRGVKKRKEARC